MKKKYLIIAGIVLLIALIIVLVLVLNKKEEEPDYPDDENTLYSIKFDNIKLRFERYDYVLGQNQVVGVQKSTNHGKDYEDMTKEGLTVSLKPLFVFLSKDLGFAIAKPNLTQSNDYAGFYVTQDGGKTFVNAKINYENPNIDILTVEDVPYYDNNTLKVKCSIYQINAEGNGYEDVILTFISNDNGLNWDLEL